MASKNYPKINCFIVGSMKSGTTLLANYLNQNDNLKINDGDSHLFLDHNDEISINKYISKNYSNDTFNIDKSASYSIMLKNYKRILNHNKESKFIWIIRDPLKRSFSNYIHALNRGLESRTFFQCFKDDLNQEVYNFNTRNYFIRSKYKFQINRMIKEVKKDKIFFLVFEDFIRNPIYFMNQINSFLKIKKCNYKLLHNDKKLNKTYTSFLYPHYPVLNKYFGKRFVLLINSKFNFKNKLKLNLKKDEQKQIVNYFKEDIIYITNHLKINISIWKL